MNRFENRKIIVSSSGENSLNIIEPNKDFKISKINYTDMCFDKIKYKIDDKVFNYRTHSIFKNSKPNIIYLVNYYGNNILKIDISKREIIDLVYVGCCPSHIAISDEYIYITNSDSNSISIVDIEEFNLIKNISVGEKPHDIKIDKQNNKLYIANSNEYTISVIDLNQDKDEKIYIDILPLHFHILDENMLILSCECENMKSSISFLNLKNQKVSKRIFIEETLLDMVILKDKNIIFSTNGGDGFLYKINYITDSIDKIYLGGMPNDILWDGDNILYITDLVKNSLLVFDINKNSIVNQIYVGKEPNGLIFL
ncbi:YncE family protein [Senegalia massiliensis]|uniref:YncE family protein n=1 Tax=Senegalia massiliensis TaxID=1720316 RepID=A0A845QYF9_9CLOT|nr:YncE family protein [Senegalia massiliensis]NBI05423.1 YncE family protein [Senegalia massiliensis]